MPRRITEQAERFPWPAEPAQRYSPDTPWLAIVNCRGPKGVWKHNKPAPPWIPLCLDLWENSHWTVWEPACQLFTQSLWRFVAMQSATGIVWGEPESLRRQLKCSDGNIITDRSRFADYLERHCQAGFVCYLSDEEKEHAESRMNKGKKQKGQDRTGQDRRGEESTERQQSTDSSTDSSARAPQTAESDAKPQDSREAPTAQAQPQEGHSSEEPGQGQGQQQIERQAAAQGLQAGNLTESDAGGDGRTAGAAQPHPRSAQPGYGGTLAEQLAWSNPMAVEFGREMYALLFGVRPPADLFEASDRIKGDVGAWVHLWSKTAARVPHTQWAALYSCLIRRVTKDLKRIKRARNPGGCARHIIEGEISHWHAGHPARAGP
jgi:hypothetical protein